MAALETRECFDRSGETLSGGVAFVGGDHPNNEGFLGKLGQFARLGLWDRPEYLRVNRVRDEERVEAGVAELLFPEAAHGDRDGLGGL
jgi:hypothetical protein